MYKEAKPKIMIQNVTYLLLLYYVMHLSQGCIRGKIQLHIVWKRKLVAEVTFINMEFIASLEYELYLLLVITS